MTSDVPQTVLGNLTDLGAEIKEIPSGKGYSSGMFWRFMVADDPTVDRYIVRDTDSRLNARERFGRSSCDEECMYVCMYVFMHVCTNYVCM